MALFTLLVPTCGAGVAEGRSTIERVNLTLDGQEPNRDCLQPAISASAWVAHASKMANFDPNELPCGSGSPPTQVISVNDSGDPADSHCESPQIVEIDDEGDQREPLRMPEWCRLPRRFEAPTMMELP